MFLAFEILFREYSLRSPKQKPVRLQCISCWHTFDIGTIHFLPPTECRLGNSSFRGTGCLQGKSCIISSCQIENWLLMLRFIPLRFEITQFRCRYHSRSLPIEPAMFVSESAVQQDLSLLRYTGVTFLG